MKSKKATKNIIMSAFKKAMKRTGINSICKPIYGWETYYIPSTIGTIIIESNLIDANDGYMQAGEFRAYANGVKVTGWWKYQENLPDEIYFD